MAAKNRPEPWLRGTLSETPAVVRAVLHALQAAEEDLVLWCRALNIEQLNARPAGLPSVAFHLKHISGSVDRLLAYAEGRDLTEEQLHALKDEPSPTDMEAGPLLQELHAALSTSAERVRRIDPSELEQSRTVGRRRLPTTVGGLLVHVADHTQRHVGQVITTARIVAAKS